ncbi:SpoIID/LytB domain-containing protein [Thermobrachium celere]|uniref:SpoIID/LytB domain-containing protein n=1 Tax=Thermobrachium celere TaxID=53422 RepID=UPI0019406AA6|nr:SpoIID/LytB domain-containing protein [Thermobrachium celere]GFR35986.1 hypothetical protein TCEA9_17980 [Thermobrachium celere]
MRRKLIGIFIMFILLFNNLSVFAAVTPDVYYSNVRVALKSMSSKQMKLVLNGDYILRLKVKNQSEQEFESFKTTLQSGTSIEIKVESDKIKYLDKACDILELEPVLSDSNLTIISNYTRSYLGHFRFIISSGNILPINKIDVENYLVGVIGHEIGFNVPFEAHKVQAVATRTYALEKIKFSNTFDLYDDESSQVYKGVLVGQELKYKDNIIKAIEETKGEVLTYKGNLISAYFSASNGGYTELSSNVWTADLPYIVSRYDEYDDPSKISNQKKMQWTKSFTTKQMEEIMLANETLSNGHCFSKIDLESITRFESGRIKNMYLECYFIINSSNIKKLLNTDKELVDVRLDNINSEPVYRFSLNEGTIILKLTELDSTLKKLGYIKRNVDNFKFIKLEDIKKDENGNVTELKIYYNKTLDKTSSRNFLDIVDKENNKKKVTLSSSLYDISYIESSDTYKFSGKGYGHGVGMSQYGVINRAYAGQKYSDILEFYFPKTNLTNLNVILRSIETDKSELIVKQPVTIKVNTYDLNNKFSFVVYKDSEEIKRIEDTQTNILDFVPNDIGIYKVVIKIKQEDSNRDYDVINTISLKVFNKPKINEINILQDKIYEKKTASFRVDAVNGTTKGKFYEFEVIKDGKSIFKKSQDSNVLSYTPSSIGEYILKVRIKDKMSTNQWDDEKEIKFSVQKEPIRLNINRTLKKGMKGADVKILQEALIKLKYLKYSKPNSVYDTATLNAVKNLQKANKLKADGVFGAGTKKVLEDRLNGVAIGSITNRAVTSTNIIYLNVGSKGQDVLRLQNRLKQLGYLNAKYVTGYFGTVTQNALKTYQKANKLPQTGVLDSATYNKIYK